MNREEKLWFWAVNTKGIGMKRFTALIDSGIDLEECFADPSILKNIGFGESVIASLKKAADMDRIEAAISQIEAKGITVLVCISRKYPALLREIAAPPPILYVKGDLSLLEGRNIAVVGTRKASENGFRNIRSIACDLAGSGVTVVSGMAIGIDSAAHLGALDAKGKTVAVLGSGIDIVYPPENRRLYDRICETGAVVSEYPPGTPPSRGTFPARNRIISGISYGVLFGEGLLGSGGHITVNCAVEENRDVFAMPGDISNPNSQLPNILIEEGANVALGAASILAYYHWGDAAETRKSDDRIDRLDVMQKKIYLAVREAGAVSVDELTERLHISSREAALSLTKLELSGFVERITGGRFEAKK
ncbi:MAG: DNA-protecting protein DprA [Clostridiales bacterium]|nr:MAG: DNA-protecting protein DprA [Clostridiales bacterium]